MITFGSRGSDLALWQTRAVAEALALATGCTYRIEVIETRGDRIVDKPLPQIGGKGLFTAELEQALREGRIDAAVHSMKDLPVADPDGLTIGAVPIRVDPSDVLVVHPDWYDESAPALPLRRGCKVGTSSHRRRAALERLRPDLTFADVRGNVPTRAQKARRGDYGAVVLAAAGIDRLQLPLDGLRRVALPVELCTPAPAQGALAVQCRSDDQRTLALLQKLHDARAERCARAERDVLYRLGGGCSMPLGVLVTEAQDGFRMLAALYGNPELTAHASAVFLDLHGKDLTALATTVADRWRALVEAPLAGRELVLLRPDGCDRELDVELAVAGARVHRVAVTRIEPIAGVVLDEELLADRALAFTSVRAIELFATAAAHLDLNGRHAYVAGPATAAVAAAHGFVPIAPIQDSGGQAVAERILAQSPRPNGVVFPCAQDRHPTLEGTLVRAGVPVAAVPLYRTVELPTPAGSLPPGATIVFTSPSAARAFVHHFAPDHQGATRSLHVAIGASTAASMQAIGLRCDAVATEPTAAGIIRCCQELSRV